MIYLTSFRRAKELKCDKYSVTLFKPENEIMPTLEFLAEKDRRGDAIRLTDASLEALAGYEKRFKEGYKARWHSIKTWLDSLLPDLDMAFCCVCPYDEIPRKQADLYGRFVCHTDYIKKMIEKHRPDIKITLDNERSKYMSVGKLMSNPHAYKIFSNVIGEEVWVATEDEKKRLAEGDSGIIYTTGELIEMAGLSREGIIAVHNTKKAFDDARVQEVTIC